MSTTTQREGLHNEEGAMMVIGLFMATLVVAMLYYVAGLGETIVFREAMQDAADASSIAGATIHARAMNLVALMNALMAGIFSVLVAIRAGAIIYAWSAMTAFSECSWYNPRPCFAGLALLGSCAQMWGEAENMKSTVDSVTDICETVQDGLKYAAPVASLAKGIQIGRTTFSPPTRFGASLGWILPIEEDDSNLICRKVILPAVPPAIAEAVRSAPSIGSDYVNRNLYAAPAATAMSAMFIDCGTVRGKPRQVEDDVELGENDFQIRGVMFGEAPYDDQEERVAIASWGRDSDAGGAYSFLKAINSFSFAQAEYFYEGDTEREEWLWAMRWRARMRRFWLPVNFGSICPGDLDCGLIGRIFGVEDMAVH